MQLFALVVAALTASAYAQIDPTAKELLRYPHAKVDDCTDGEWKSLKVRSAGRHDLRER